MRQMTKTNARRRALLRTGLLSGLTAAATIDSLASTNIAHVPSRPITTDPTRLRFALLGDNPYGPSEVEAVRGAIRQASKDSAFLIHVGDFKSGIESCSDDLLAARLALLKESSRPLMLALGDNEWTDCSRFLAGNYDPLERLNKGVKRLAEVVGIRVCKHRPESCCAMTPESSINSSQSIIVPFRLIPCTVPASAHRR